MTAVFLGIYAQSILPKCLLLDEVPSRILGTSQPSKPSQSTLECAVRIVSNYRGSKYVQRNASLKLGTGWHYYAQKASKVATEMLVLRESPVVCPLRPRR
jgi:hypothetical protein